MKETTIDEKEVRIETDNTAVAGTLGLVRELKGMVLFAHGSGSSRHSSRNRQVAAALNEAGFGTLLMDLLTEAEERVDRITAHLRFDIPLLARRLEGAIQWLRAHEKTRVLPVGLFGASTGAAAALIAAANQADHIRAVVSRGGRPDLAGSALKYVRAPTLLIVGERDIPVIGLNEAAYNELTSEKQLEIVLGASHLFEEPGALEQVSVLSIQWFTRYLAGSSENNPGPLSSRGSTSGRDPGETRVYFSPGTRAQLIGEEGEPFSVIEGADLSALMERIGEAKVVLLGEASHGTAEFYRMRQKITQALILELGFNVVAAEADWPDAEHVDEYVRARDPRVDRAEEAFSRFPSWMWRNHEVLAFVEWLREQNEKTNNPEEKVGFYGLDMYSMYSSIREVIRYLEDVDYELAQSARDRYGCLMPFHADPGLYGKAVITNRYQECEEEVVEVLKDLLDHRLDLAGRDGDQFLDAQQNARVVASAEQYYRIMFYGSPESWNLRDQHMFDTLQNLMEHRGPDARAVVWAHNSHVGNAAATEMAVRGEHNIGKLSRDALGTDAFLVGFGTHAGTVAAASNWGGMVEFKNVRPSHENSYERLCHDSGSKRFMLHLRDPDHSEIRPQLSEPRLERAIGVIYRPDTELQSHYFQAILPEQFDEYIWFDHSEAVRPLERSSAPLLPERHPFLLGD